MSIILLLFIDAFTVVIFPISTFDDINFVLTVFESPTIISTPCNSVEIVVSLPTTISRDSIFKSF